MKEGDYTIKKWADSVAIKNSKPYKITTEFRTVYSCLDSKSALKACHTLDARLVKPVIKKERNN